MSVTGRMVAGERFSGVRGLLRQVSQDSSVLTAPSPRIPLDVSGVSEEELQRELSLLGYPRVPQQVILQFKEDLERLMSESRDVTAPLTKPRKGPSSSWDCASDWTRPTLSSGQDSFLQDKEDEHVGGQRLEPQRAPLRRKVLRRTSTGQTCVTESSVFTESEDWDKSDSHHTESCSPAPAEYAKSFIRPPPYSLLDQYRQRSDPVTRYQEYKQSWNAIQGALEQSRKVLRWEIREQMMSAPPQPLPRSLPTPNSYIVPTDKKRYGLRWAVRRDLVNGVMPRSSFS